MSELPIGEPNAVVVTPNAISAGSMLRKAREASGLHVAALAVSMKVPVKKLEALEADRLDLLPDAVFVRALAASVCRALKIDPAPVLERLPRGNVPRLNAEERSINTPFRARGERSDWSVSDFFSKPAVVLVVVLVLSALGVAFFPESQPAENLGSVAENKSTTVERALDGSKLLQPDPIKPGIEIVPSSAIGAISNAPTVKPEEHTPVSSAYGTAANESPALITFRAKGASWIQVTDSTGGVLLNKTLMASESFDLAAAPPVLVVVGRADVTEVEVRGKPFSLLEVSKENVARFEVK